jgi:F0F1-type ATP synthase delta subunit
VPSRSHVAAYTASQLLTADQSTRSEIVQNLAAWLIDSGQTRQVQYLLGDIAWHLQQNNYIVASVKSARPLDTDTRQQIINYIDNQYSNDLNIELVEYIDPSLIGGIVITTPNGVFDISVLQKLKKFSKGVI